MDVAQGHYWHIAYQLDNRDPSRDEIRSTYETEAQRSGWKVFDRGATRRVFRLTQPGGDNGTDEGRQQHRRVELDRVP